MFEIRHGMDPLRWQNRSLVSSLNCNIFVRLRQWVSWKLRWVSIKIALLTYRRRGPLVSPFIGRGAKREGPAAAWNRRTPAVRGSRVPVLGPPGPCAPGKTASANRPTAPETRWSKAQRDTRKRGSSPGTSLRGGRPDASGNHCAAPNNARRKRPSHSFEGEDEQRACERLEREADSPTKLLFTLDNYIDNCKIMCYFYHSKKRSVLISAKEGSVWSVVRSTWRRTGIFAGL